MSLLLARVAQRDNVLTLPHKTSQIIRPVMDGGPDNSFGERRLMMQLQSAALKEASEAWHLWFEAQQLCNRTQSCSSSHRDKVTTAGVSTWHFSALCGHSICRHSWHSRGPAHSLLTGVRLGYLCCETWLWQWLKIWDFSPHITVKRVYNAAHAIKTATLHFLRVSEGFFKPGEDWTKQARTLTSSAPGAAEALSHPVKTA